MLSSTCATLTSTCRITPYRVHLLCVSSDTAYPASVQPSQFQFNLIGSLCSGIPIEYIPPLPCPAIPCCADSPMRWR